MSLSASSLSKHFATTAVLALLLAPPAFSKGGDTKETKCPKGQVENDDGDCVDVSDESASNEALYQQGRFLALDGRYDEALGVLAFAPDTDSRVLTYRAFATRQLGDIETGMALYEDALTLDPANTLARSYMGRAYLLQDDRYAAAAQLGEIARLEGAATENYRELAAALARYDGGETSYSY